MSWHHLRSACQHSCRLMTGSLSALCGGWPVLTGLAHSFPGQAVGLLLSCWPCYCSPAIQQNFHAAGCSLSSFAPGTYTEGWPTAASLPSLCSWLLPVPGAPGCCCPGTAVAHSSVAEWGCSSGSPVLCKGSCPGQGSAVPCSQ